MLTHNNWFTHNYPRGGQLPKYADNWHIEFTHTELNTDIKFDQAVAQAIKILAEKNSSLVIQYSGGLDSEIIIREALKNNIDVIPYTMRFINDYNDHEIHYCKILESELGIKINYIDIDIMDWLHNPDFHHGFCYYIKEHSLWHPAAPLAWWLREIIAEIEGDCCVINGSGDTPLTLKPHKFFPDIWQWNVSFNLDGHWKRLWYSQKYFPDDAPLFFLYTPEIHHSYLTHELFQHCVESDSFKLGPSSTRHELYHTFYPEIMPRPKYTGFEKLIAINNPEIGIDLRSYSCAMSTKYISYEKYLRMLRV